MRTTDFSRAPRQGRAEAMVVVSVAGRGRGRRAREAARAADAAPGFVWRASARRRAERGVIAYFATPGAARAYADGTAGTSARVRVLEALGHGYSNGVWRAEGDVMAHIERFTATSAERARGDEPRPVAGEVDLAAARAWPGRRAGAGPARPLVDSTAMFIGATRYRGPRALAILSRTWYPMIARMRTMRGYVWHTVYWEPPFTLGTLAFFATADDLLAFARLPAHRHLMQWITRGTRNGTGGYIRLHVAPESGGGRGDERGER